ncbi:MAG TPA: ester cyclase [Thermomicrobiales bacterium]|nr:ester cyclase [Thermomicrobiales bacterium]
MSVETNMALVRRFFEEVVNARRLDMLREITAPDYINHNLATPNPGVEGMRQVIEMFVAGFPDLRVTLHDVIAEGDRVCTRGTMSGTQQGQFLDMEPTGRPISVEYIDIWRVEDGKLAENWVQIDLLGLKQQLEPIEGGAPILTSA